MKMKMKKQNRQKQLGKREMFHSMEILPLLDKLFDRREKEQKMMMMMMKKKKIAERQELCD